MLMENKLRYSVKLASRVSNLNNTCVAGNLWKKSLRVYSTSNELHMVHVHTFLLKSKWPRIKFSYLI